MTATELELISGVNGLEIVGMFYVKELQKANQTEFRIEKVITRKNDKFYSKWKGYDNSFNSWLDKKILWYKISYFIEPGHSKNEIS